LPEDSSTLCPAISLYELKWFAWQTGYTRPGSAAMSLGIKGFEEKAYFLKIVLDTAR
jgi:hypothetical protein